MQVREFFAAMTRVEFGLVLVGHIGVNHDGAARCVSQWHHAHDPLAFVLGTVRCVLH